MNKEERELTKEYEIADKIADAKEAELDMMSFDSFSEYEHACKGIFDEVNRIGRKLKLVKTPVMEDLDDIGDHMTMEDFEANCAAGGFINYDGHGYYASETQQCDIIIMPSEVISRNIRTDFTHVKWYNR